MKGNPLHVWFGKNWDVGEKSQLARYIEWGEATTVTDIDHADLIVVDNFDELEQMERQLPDGVPCLYLQPNDQAHPTWIYGPHFREFGRLFALLSLFKRHIENSSTGAPIH